MSRTAIVTGAGRGIGYGIAQQLGSEGYRIAILDVIAPADCRENLHALAQAGVDCYYHQGSIAERADREAFVDAVISRYGDIDVLVNNAGVAPSVRRDILDMTEESFDHVLGVVLKGTMFMTQLVARRMLTQPMKGRKRGTIINITSSNVVISSPNRAEYCAAKAGLSALGVVYADRLAAERVLVYEIRPGVIETDMTRVVHDKYSKLIAEGAFPIARWGTPEDVALAVSAFCDDKFAYSTGNHIDVDGGFHIPRL